jgi:hypothetical protein
MESLLKTTHWITSTYQTGQFFSSTMCASWFSKTWSRKLQRVRGLWLEVLGMPILEILDQLHELKEDRKTGQTKKQTWSKDTETS